jgi:hypothetical protein
MFNRERLPDPESFYESEGLVLVGHGRWRTTRCVFHGGSDSLRIEVKSGGYVCMNCGVSGGDILDYVQKAHDLDFKGAAIRLGCWDDESPGMRPAERKAAPLLPLRRAVDVLAQEARTLLLSANELKAGRPLTDPEWDRLLAACSRIETLAEEFGT